MATIALARGAVNCTFRQQADSLTTRSASRHDWAVDVMAITHGCDSRAPYGRACGQAWYDSNAMACCSILGSVCVAFCSLLCCFGFEAVVPPLLL
mmetsp:Transcript_1948/g.6121  ORF Transcript_1948/g.6121 Transcript_1948/m.6121 type:complete len:95 (+) Transcript_1948:906-1190(+)